MKIRILSIVCLLALFCSLVACGSGNKTPGTGASGSPEPSAPTPANIRIYTLNGTTGFGMAKLMEDVANGSVTGDNYTIEVKTDAQNDVVPALINGSIDIAALPTNLASTLYNRTDGGVRILAINTLGCLHLATNNGTVIESWNDLKGKTVYVPAANPTFLFTYLCRQNGLEVGKDVIISNTYSAPADLQGRFAAGAKITGASDEVAIAVLPEPIITATTAAANKNGVTVTRLMDLSAEWDKLPGKAGTLVQGCVVVRTAFLEAHPDAVARFMTAYRASVEYVNAEPENAAALIVKHGIFANAAVATQAIPRCNIAYLDGTDMQSAMKVYLEILQSVNAASIGGKLPGDDFYYSTGK